MTSAFVLVRGSRSVTGDAGIKLTSVTSEAWSKSSLSMLEALIAGERDPARLAQLAQSTMRPKIPALIDAVASIPRCKSQRA